MDYTLYTIKHKDSYKLTTLKQWYNSIMLLTFYKQSVTPDRILRQAPKLKQLICKYERIEQYV